MSIEEFAEYIEQEGLEYFLRFKTNGWRFVNNPELVSLCEQYITIAEKIESIVKINK